MGRFWIRMTNNQGLNVASILQRVRSVLRPTTIRSLDLFWLLYIHFPRLFLSICELCGTCLDPLSSIIEVNRYVTIHAVHYPDNLSTLDSESRAPATTSTPSSVGSRSKLNSRKVRPWKMRRMISSDTKTQKKAIIPSSLI